ncbi:hypothetical protein [Acetobacter aceti]|uniref:Uncharacterized protein n=1 Tax=Acetobacter aceti TaxID=435 RepID=A0A6S6PF24_ACEAC|nr:hypothetical protein [Acetobacter aceti]BCI65566.1 hypothetical protein AAJCM20276_01900 [Acetobacter aceti]
MTEDDVALLQNVARRGVDANAIILHLFSPFTTVVGNPAHAIGKPYADLSSLQTLPSLNWVI